MSAFVGVHADPRWFEGHFPGHPVLPGVGGLALALQALEQALGSVRLAGIAHMRLRRPVLPGQDLRLSWRETGRGRLRIDLAHAGVQVANAELLLGDAPPPPPASFSTSPAPACFPEPSKLLPHEPPMRLLAAIREQTPRGLRGAALVPAACALATGGFTPALAAVEAAAQAAAAWEALVRRQENGDAAPRIGYLVGLRDVTLYRATLPVECEFVVAAELEEIALPLTRYRIEAELDGAVVAAGGIATYLAGTTT